jgi:hypothetical protein
MSVYRFYSIEKNGHIAGPPVVYELPQDHDALREAKKLLDGRDIEIWQDARLVAYLVPSGDQPHE